MILQSAVYYNMLPLGNEGSAMMVEKKPTKKHTTLTIRIPVETKAIAEKRADAEKRSVTKYIEHLIEQDAEAHKAKR